MARAAGVDNASYVFLEILPGSVTLHFIITLPTANSAGATAEVAQVQADAVKATIEATLPTAAAASSFLAVPVLSAPTVTTVLEPTSNNNDDGDQRDSVAVATEIIVICMCGGVLALALIYKGLQAYQRRAMDIEKDTSNLIGYKGASGPSSHRPPAPGPYAITQPRHGEVTCAKYI